MKTEKNGKIEFLRFIFAVIICLRHSSYFVEEMFNSKAPFWGGAFAVEFFFIVSGYLMMATIEKRWNTENLDLTVETKRFLIRKFYGIYPKVLLAWVIGFFVTFVFNIQYSLKDMVIIAIQCIPELLMTSSAGVAVVQINSVSWYISAMLLSMAILYPLLLKYKTVARDIFIPLLTIFILGYLMKNTKSLRNPSLWIGFTTKGMLRGFCEIMMGVIVYKITYRIKKIEYTRLGSLILTLTEAIAYTAIIFYCTQKSGKNDFIFIFVYMAAIAITFSNKTIGSRFFQNKVCWFLGKFSVYLYLNHYYYAVNLKNIMPENVTKIGALASYVLISLLTASAAMLIDGLIQRHKGIFTYGIKKLIISQ